MRHRNRPLSLLLIGLVSFIILACLIYFFPPTANLTFPETLPNLPFSLENYLQIPPLFLFFLLTAIFFFSIGSYILKSKAHGILIAGLVITFLLFRLYHLTHPFFLILLLALFFTLEMFVSSRGDAK
jgi:hypothetical protein